MVSTNLRSPILVFWTFDGRVRAARLLPHTNTCGRRLRAGDWFKWAPTFCQFMRTVRCLTVANRGIVAWKSILDEIACRFIRKFAGVVMCPGSNLAIVMFMSLSPTW